VNRVVTLVTGAVTVAVVAVLAPTAWRHVGVWRAERARAAFMDQGRTYAARVLERVAVLPEALRETSGLVISRTQPGILWSHNDSSDAPRLYALDIAGTLLATVSVERAMAVDWEDIAAGPCPGARPEAASQPSSCLYIADTGNNNRDRRTLTVYIVEEPRHDESGAFPGVVAATSFRFEYPGEPDDAEAIAVMPDGDVVIVTKGRVPTTDFFTLPAADVARASATGEVLTAVHAGTTGVVPDANLSRLITAAALSPDGTTLAVRTYTEVFFYGAERSGGTLGWRDLGRRCFLGEAESQGEAIDFLDAETMLLTTESSPDQPAAIYRLRC
jgi:hypothetical protein